VRDRGPEPRPPVGDPVMASNPGDGPLTAELLEPIGRDYLKWPLLLTAMGGVVFVVTFLYTIFTGIGVWGNDIPNAWALGITNLVWWIGIGHAGTFISAFLLLLEQQSWRTSINRIAEAMTLFAVIMAASFPVVHLGRAWFAYWLIPYPSTTGMWPNFRSALAWDTAAISTYFTVSLLFWYVGLIPDLATVRDTARSWAKRRIFGIFALGWRGSVRHWHHHKALYGLLAGLATPLVVSVHTVISFDFATGKVPGWHSTIFPPFFVAGAIFSGFAMVLTLLLPARKILRLEAFITERHLDAMAKITLLTASIVTYAYIIEHFIAWYTGSPYENHQMNVARTTGPYAVLFWTQIACNAVIPQLLWKRSFRRSPWALFVVSIFINVGMWLERYMIIVGSLSRDYLPSSWQDYLPTVVDGVLFFSSISAFLFLFLLFMRNVPAIPIYEAKELGHTLGHAEPHGASHGASHGPHPAGEGAPT
jgi:Ni/Fe-hydrogenase subunit HybB-like protein